MLRKYISVFILILTTALAAQAKDMTYRLGAGFKNNSAEDIPSLALIYFAAKDIAYTGSFGLDSKQNYAKMQASAGLRKIIFFEPNLNFYIGGQAGVLNSENPVDGKNSGVEVMAVGGVEFFFAGLESLGFSAEAGAGLSTLKNTRLRTLANDPLRAGITFYF